MYRPVLVTAPSATPVSLTEVKNGLGISVSTHDTVLTALIGVAVSHFDGWTGILGRCLMTQAWRQDFVCFDRELLLPLRPVSAITSVKYDDTSAVEQTISDTNYTLQTGSLGSYIQFKSTYSFPSLNNEKPSVRVTYAAGYADAASVPGAIRQAIILMVGHLFQQTRANPVASRESVDGVGSIAYADPAVAARGIREVIDNLVGPFRVVSL